MTVYEKIQQDKKEALGKDAQLCTLLGFIISEVQRKTLSNDFSDRQMDKLLTSIIASNNEVLENLTDPVRIKKLQDENTILTKYLPKKAHPVNCMSFDDLCTLLKGLVAQDEKFKEARHVFPYIKANFKEGEIDNSMVNKALKTL